METSKRQFMDPTDLDDPAYGLLKIQIHNVLKDTIDKMDLRDCDEGAVTIKISLKTEETALPYRLDTVKKLSVDWKLTGQITEKTQSDGDLYEADKFYMATDDRGNPILKRIEDAQHSIDEFI